MSSLTCECGKMASPKCIDLQCGACCKNEECERHKNKANDFNVPIELLTQIFDMCQNYHNEMNDDIVSCDGCHKDYEEYEMLRCSACDNIYCDECKGFYSDQLNNDRYCEDCYVPPEDPKCVSCQKQSDILCWECDSCEEVFCEQCLEPNIFIDECSRYNCYYCQEGRCWNSKLFNLCNRCFDNSLNPNEIEMDKMEKLIASNKYDQLIKNLKSKGFNVRTIEKNIEDVDCEICMTENVDCVLDCKHEMCMDCITKNFYIYGKNECPFCLKEFNKSITFYQKPSQKKKNKTKPKAKAKRQVKSKTKAKTKKSIKNTKTKILKDDKKRLSIEQKVKELLAYMSKNKKIPPSTKKDLFTDGSCMGSFWKQVKYNKKCEKPVYKKLLKNDLLKSKYQTYHQKN